MLRFSSSSCFGHGLSPILSLVKVCIPVFPVPKFSWNIFAFDFQERVTDTSAKPSHFAGRPNVASYAPPMITMDNDDGIPYKGLVKYSVFILQRLKYFFNPSSAFIYVVCKVKFSSYLIYSISDLYRHTLAPTCVAFGVLC